MRQPPDAFVERLRTTFPGEGWTCSWDPDVGRWRISGLSASGSPIHQWVCWYRDATTGEPIAPDPATGIHPFRELDQSCQDEVIRNMQRSFVGRTGDPLKDWSLFQQANRRHNQALMKARAKERANTFADLLRETDVRRPGWLKHHSTNKTERRIARS